MRKIRLFAHISLDGVIAPGAPDDESEFAKGGWTAPYRSPDGAAAAAAAQGIGFDLLLGRRTYDLWAGFWPKVQGGPFAEHLNAAKKYVATHRPDGLSWGPVEAIGASIPDSVRALRSRGDSDLIIWGSSTLTAPLFEHGLIDEVVLIVYPLLLGPGRRFFSGNAHPHELARTHTQAFPSGVTMTTYRCVGPLQRPSTQTA